MNVSTSSLLLFMFLCLQHNWQSQINVLFFFSFQLRLILQCILKHIQLHWNLTISLGRDVWLLSAENVDFNLFNLIITYKPTTPPLNPGLI